MTGVGYRFTGSYTRHEVTGLPQRIRDKLSFRQQEVCELVALGKSNKFIAAALRIEECTVRLYVKRVAERLGLEGNDDCRVSIARHVVFAWMEQDEAA